MGAAQLIPALLARQMVSRLAGQGGGPGGPGGPGGGPPQSGPQGQPSEMAGQQIAGQLAELNNADPDMILKMLNQVKSVLVALYPRTAFTLPGVARNVAQCQKYLDNAIKEAEQGAATAQTVQPPIANSAGQPMSLRQPPDAQGGMGLEQFASQGM